MRLVKPFAAMAALLAAIFAVLWQTGVVSLDGGKEDVGGDAIVLAHPAEVEFAASLRIVAETQRIKEVLGETSMGDRWKAMQQAALALNSDHAPQRRAELVAERKAAAERLLALVRAAIAAPHWPPGDAAAHAAYAQALLREAELAYLSASVTGRGIAEALEPAATALALARGIENPPPSFLMISSDIADAAKALPAPALRQPERGDMPTPPTALPVPMGN